ncbi:MAG: hypothetical protein MUC80_00405 [Candidatus Thermoplasmatota archaeon]|jgi:hypothetical protein|nr:hypothetical protein [Candidatus Thermoplasmatota archaeon]
MINLRTLENEPGGKEGARPLFERMIRHLLKIKHGDVTGIRPAPGDWGIDVIKGDFTTGNTMIWQVKYFVEGIGKSQKDQIRNSFEQVIKKAKLENFEIRVWTLCIPCLLSAKEKKWWEQWSKEKSNETQIKIQLMDETEIEQMLLSPDAEIVRSGFFGDNPSMLKYYLQCLKGEIERDIQELPDQKLYDKALFIKKILAAGFTETISARTQFFNAELIKAEITDKNDEKEKAELNSLYEKIRSMWESRFNMALNSSDPVKEVPKVYSEMLKAIEQSDSNILKSPKLFASFVHKQGFMQQLADICEIGWIPNFRELGKEND